MKTKNLLAWIGALAVVALLAWWMNRGPSHGTSSGVTIGNPVVGDLALDEVAQVEIIRDGETVELGVSDGNWVVRSMGNYPVDFATLKDHLLKISDLKIGQVVRGGREQLEAFGLDGDGTLAVSFMDAQGDLLARLVLGDFREGGSGRYAIAPSGEVVLVGDGLTAFPTRATGWVERQLVHVNGPDLRTIESTVNNVTSTLTVGPDNTYDLSPLPEGHQVDPAKAGKLARALQYLNFDDVASPEASDEALALNDPVRWVGTTRDGLVYRLQVGHENRDGGTWVRLEVSYDAPAAPERSEGQTDEAWEQAKAAHAASVQRARKKADALSSRSGWTYRIPGFNGDNFRVTAVELSQPAAAEEENGQEGTSSVDLNRSVEETVDAATRILPARPPAPQAP